MNSLYYFYFFNNCLFKSTSGQQIDCIAYVFLQRKMSFSTTENNEHVGGIIPFILKIFQMPKVLSDNTRQYG